VPRTRAVVKMSSPKTGTRLEHYCASSPEFSKKKSHPIGLPARPFTPKKSTVVRSVDRDGRYPPIPVFPRLDPSDGTVMWRKSGLTGDVLKRKYGGSLRTASVVFSDNV